MQNNFYTVSSHHQDEFFGIFKITCPGTYREEGKNKV